ncbi:MAG TPA: SH3 domain-containing protein [Coxiellaceae bacterium]|nr:MAG: hypothetical protein A3E81_05270 [Gammaproteobacteria bacterium RIFCSPHIGHO2_12_FULL_36_30]HLB55830.1 SH3 domain-containing protein [Coxiellaceae bacterium]
MKKIIITSLTTISLICGSAVFAATTPIPEKTKPPVEKTIEKKTAKKSAEKAVISTINLYELPETNSKIIKTLPLFSNLVAIYRKDDWMKVGDRADGTTGWINLSQYNQAKNNYYQEHFKMNSDFIYLQSEKNDKGKTEIVAYRNGKKLTPAEAKELYDHMQLQEQKQWNAMQRFNQMMDQQMQSVFQMPLMMPNIVVIQQPINTEKNEK